MADVGALFSEGIHKGRQVAALTIDPEAVRSQVIQGQEDNILKLLPASGAAATRKQHAQDDGEKPYFEEGRMNPKLVMNQSSLPFKYCGNDRPPTEEFDLST